MPFIDPGPDVHIQHGAGGVRIPISLCNSRLRLPTVQSLFRLDNISVNGISEAVDANGFTHTTYVPDSILVITGTDARRKLLGLLLGCISSQDMLLSVSNDAVC